MVLSTVPKNKNKGRYEVWRVHTLLHDFTGIRYGRENLIHLLYLFAEQRMSIQRSCQKSGETTPFSEKGKEQQRALRRYKGTEKQAMDKEKGKLLKAMARNEREARDKETGVSSLSQTVADFNI